MCSDVYDNLMTLDEVVIAGTDVDPTSPPSDMPPLNGPDNTPVDDPPKVPTHSFGPRQRFSFSL
jgi:hypothetical protein